MQKRSNLLPSICLLILFLPRVAFANAGTPLMWASIAHLFIGNLIIGICEGLLIVRIFKTNPKKTIPLTILANYFSACIGSLFFSWVFHTISPTLPWVRFALCSGIIGAYTATILLEWPFILYSFGQELRSLKKTFKASVITQTASYALLIPYYGLASGTSLIFQSHIVNSYSEWVYPQAVVYFISDKDGDIYRTQLNTSKFEKIASLNSKDRNDRLFVRQSKDTSSWDLFALTQQEKGDPKETLILPNFTTKAALTWRGESNNEEAGSWFNFGNASDLRPENERAWQVRTGFWASQGITMNNKNTGEYINLAFETPFVNWPSRNATILPGDQVIYQLGTQICIFNRKTRDLALITFGRGPIVALDTL